MFGIAGIVIACMFFAPWIKLYSLFARKPVFMATSTLISGIILNLLLLAGTLVLLYT